jgi:hypothetical protein
MIFNRALRERHDKNVVKEIIFSIKRYFIKGQFSLLSEIPVHAATI